MENRFCERYLHQQQHHAIHFYRLNIIAFYVLPQPVLFCTLPPISFHYGSINEELDI